MQLPRGCGNRTPAVSAHLGGLDLLQFAAHGSTCRRGNPVDLGQRAVEAVVKRISGPVVGGLAIALYAGIGLALPLALHWSRVGLVGLNVGGATLAGLVLLAWLAVRVEAGHRRHLVEWNSDLRLLDAEEFEWLVGEVFRREGWKVDETGRQDGPDGNIDLRLSRNGRRVVAQCKRWESWQVSVDEIRRFLGTLLRESLPADSGIFVTLSGFTSQAREEAEQAGLTLVDGRELLARVEKVRRAEPCPDCQTPMLLDRSKFGWWFRCTVDGCGGKRNLDSDPGRAVALLLAG